jgi:4-alpha-glucanotransferase
MLLNPLHAATPVPPLEPSPYFASTRVFRDVVYVRIEEVPGASSLPDLAELTAAGRALNAGSRIDRDAVAALKLDALARLYERFAASGGHPDHDAFEAEKGELLQRWGLFCALAERHGAGWQRWPAELRHPDSPGVAAAALDPAIARRSAMHRWCQWVLEVQLAEAASAGVGLIGDLAVGFDAGGADGWMFQDQLALDCRIGAPPDRFNADGQDWGLPPFVPWKLRASGYAPLVATLRAAFAHMRGGLRIDHAMGLFRLYWIHGASGPRSGAYVYYPHEELLDLVALEAHRAGAAVVGEDLGTVEDYVRIELADRQILSTRLLWFEDEPPSAFPERALGAITTHDLPTVVGVFTGADRQAQRSLGRSNVAEGDEQLRQRLLAAVGDAAHGDVAAVVVAAHRALAESPSLWVTASLDDALLVPDRPNMPGTIDEWPNWRQPLPRPIEELPDDPVVNAVAAALREGRRGRSVASPPC